MRSFWSDPFLWIHLAGLAALPLWLELCWLALAAGDPVLPFGLELLLVAAIGVAPVFWMQWQRPFYIFSLIAVALKPTQLTEDQRRLLTLFKAPRTRFLAIAGAVLAILALRQLYYLAPIAAPVTPFSSESRGLGLLVAAIAFLGVNLFLQVPISVLNVLFTGDSTFAATTPYPLEQIRSDFTLLGIPVNQILPPIVPEPKPVAVVTSPDIPSSFAPEVSASEPVLATDPSKPFAPEKTVEEVDAEDWFAESPPPIIPDAEVERVNGGAAVEPTTTEMDLVSDVWEEKEPTTNLEAIADAVEATTIEAPVHLTESGNPLEENTPTAIANSQAPDSSDASTALTELVNPLADDIADAIVHSEASTPAEETGLADAIVHSEASTPVEETVSSVELVNLLEETNAEPEPPSESLIVSEINLDTVETTDSEVTAASTETPTLDPEHFPLTNPAPEDHKE